MSEALQVYWETNIVGRLWRDKSGDFIFQYAAEWLDHPSAIPLSIRLPLREEPFQDPVPRIFFSNILPEGNVRTLVARKLGISESNDYELLKALGGDCAGAISLFPEGREFSVQGDYEPVSAKDLDKMVEEISTRPLLIWKDELRLSLAGAQQKLPVYFENGKIFLPRGGYPSSHILKPAIKGFDAILENEAFCMRLAKHYGLPVPETVILEGKQRFYLVERYDRKKDEKGHLSRLHQEDFCQALGYSYNAKYESEGGPNLKSCFSMISNHGTQPILDKKVLFQWIIFNFLIGNCDAHAKNISMLITKEDYRLAPLYDLVSTCVYPALSAKHAMRIGGEYRSEWILREHWERLAKDAEFGVKAALVICREMSEKLPTQAAKLGKEFSAQYGKQKILENICKNISSLGKRTIEFLKI